MQIAVVSYCLPIVAVGGIAIVVLGGAKRAGDPSSTAIFLAALAVFFTTVVGALLGFKAADRAEPRRRAGLRRSRGSRSCARCGSSPRCPRSSTRCRSRCRPRSSARCSASTWARTDRGVGITLIRLQGNLDSARVWAVFLLCARRRAGRLRARRPGRAAVTPWVSGRRCGMTDVDPTAPTPPRRAALGRATAVSRAIGRSLLNAAAHARRSCSRCGRRSSASPASRRTSPRARPTSGSSSSRRRRRTPPRTAPSCSPLLAQTLAGRRARLRRRACSSPIVPGRAVHAVAAGRGGRDAARAAAAQRPARRDRAGHHPDHRPRDHGIRRRDRHASSCCSPRSPSILFGLSRREPAEPRPRARLRRRSR